MIRPLRYNARQLTVYLTAAALMIGGILALDLYLERSFSNSLRSQFRAEIDSEIEALQDWKERRRSEMSAIVADPHVVDLTQQILLVPPDKESLLASEAQQQLREHFKSWFKNHLIQGIFLIARDGTSLASMRDTNLGSQNLLTLQPETLEKAWNGQVVLSKLQPSDVVLQSRPSDFGDLTFFVLGPVRDDAGQVVAVFALRLSPYERLFAPIRQADSADGDDILGFDHFGHLVSLSPNGSILHSESSSPLMPMSASGEDFDGYELADGTKKVGVWRWDSELGFGYLKQAPISVITGYKTPLRIASLVLGVLLLTTLGSLYSTLRAMRMREREQEQLLHLVMHSTRDLNALVDENGRILRVNKASQSILGVPMEEAIGLDLTSMRKPHVRHQLSNFQGARILQSLAEDSAEEHRCFLRRYQGPMLPCLVTVRSFHTVDAQTEYLVIIHDYSGADAQEEELTSAVSRAEAAGRAKSAFLSMISHELRSPVASVSAALRFVEEHVKNVAGREVLHSAQRSTGLLLSIIDDILDYSRLEAEQLSLSPEPMKLCDALRDVVDVLHWSADEAGVELITECDDTLPAIQADALRIRQVLINLIGNAVKFSARLDHKGEVRVSLKSHRRTDETVEVALLVADNGIGIEEDQVTEIFAPFTQGKNEDRRAKGGAGLGLSIVARLVALMDGSIDVNSRKGVGTQVTVNFSFPISKEAGRVVRLHTSSKGTSASKLIG